MEKWISMAAAVPLFPGDAMAAKEKTLAKKSEDRRRQRAAAAQRKLLARTVSDALSAAAVAAAAASSVSAYAATACAAATAAATAAAALATSSVTAAAAIATSDEEDDVEDEDEDDEESNIEGTMMEVLHLDAAVITPMDTLHTHGCVIIPGALDLPDQLIEAIKEVNYNKAGLPQAPDTLLGYDPRRMQSLASRRTVPWIASISKLVSAHLSMYGLTTTSSKEAKELKHVHALKSLANVAYDESETSPQDGDQSKHMDESPEYVATFMQQPGMTDADRPLSILVALDARVRLRVWPRRGISPLMILLDPGEVLVFRGDTCHAGLGYSIENVRVHMYLYHPAYRPPPSSIYACPPG